MKECLMLFTTTRGEKLKPSLYILFTKAYSPYYMTKTFMPLRGLYVYGFVVLLKNSWVIVISMIKCRKKR